MNKLLCFKINGMCLYKEIDLLNYQVPIFFVCIDDYGNRYLVLCIDIDEYEYIIAKVTDNQLKSMLEEKVEMRDVFLNTTEIYHVVSASDINDDIVELVNADNLAKEDLPDEGAYFTIKNNIIDSYLCKLRNSYIDIFSSKMEFHSIKIDERKNTFSFTPDCFNQSYYQDKSTALFYMFNLIQNKSVSLIADNIKNKFNEEYDLYERSNQVFTLSY